MPGTIIPASAGTVYIKTSPGVLNSLFVNNGTFGSVSVFDAAGTATFSGTPVYRWVPAALGEQRELNIPCGTGIAVVLAANTLLYAIYDRKGA